MSLIGAAAREREPARKKGFPYTTASLHPLDCTGTNSLIEVVRNAAEIMGWLLPSLDLPFNDFMERRSL